MKIRVLSRGLRSVIGRLRFMKTRLVRSWCLLTAILLFLAMASSLLAAGHEHATAETDHKHHVHIHSYGPYCGLYCLYTLIRATGKDIDFRDLLRPEYISSEKGSTLPQLKKAVEDNGMYAEVVEKLTSLELRHSPYPIILHTKSGVDRDEYDHVELFLGTRKGKARLCDPPEPIRSVPLAELAPRWGGAGLIVSPHPVDLRIIFAPARKLSMIFLVIAMAAISTVYWVRQRWFVAAKISCRRFVRRSVAQGAGFAIAALLCGMICHVANDEGFLANPNATASIQQAHLGNFIPKIGEKKVHRLLDGDAVFVDARLTCDFDVGHLEGAISIPVEADDTKRRKATAEIRKDAAVVVYCQSASCRFAEKVAVKLISDGFSNISIFKGGWNEWVAKNDK